MISIITRGGTHAGGWLVTLGREERGGVEEEMEGSQQMESCMRGGRNVDVETQMDQVDKTRREDEGITEGIN